MEEFRVLLEIKNKGNKYKVLSNNRYEKYFLKISEDRTLIYPTIQEFSELYEIFKNKGIKKYSYEINNNNRGKIKNGKIKLEPKVVAGTTLISLALAITFIANSKENNNISKENIAQISNSQYYEQPSVKQIKQDKLKEEMKLNEDETIEFLKSGEIEAKKISDKTYYIQKYKDYIYCNSAEEFGKYVENSNPTYDDIRNALETNNNIKEKYKNIILKGIDNLEEKLPNMNLSVLYYNISRMKITETTIQDIKKECGANVIAYFNKMTGEIMVDENCVQDNTILHEVLGHGATCASLQIENKNVIMGTELLIYFDETGNVEVFGDSMSEAEADMIGEKGTEETYQYSQEYLPISEQLRIFMSTAEVNLETLLNKGSKHLVEKLYSKGIKDPFIYIEQCDSLCRAMQSGIPITEPENAIKNNVKTFLKEYATSKLEQGEDIDSIIQQINKIMLDTDKLNIVIYDNKGSYGNIEMSELREEIIENIKPEVEQEER